VAEYLALIYEGESARSASLREVAELVEARMRYLASLRAAGTLVDAGFFHPQHEAIRLPSAADAREGLCARASLYLWLSAENLDEARTQALNLPTRGDDELELRAIAQSAPISGRDRPGRLFAGLVHGDFDEPSAFEQLMSRIDETSRSAFGSISFLGGVRLAPPDAPSARLMLGDGPSIETKELLGGLFVVRMASSGDARAWAASTSFATLGRLMLRELWRA
jgi:hypothetical protein